MDRDPFQSVQRAVVRCELCPRLRAHCQAVAAKRRPLYRQWEYWGRPVPAFGSPPARLLIVGLAPAAHGANRTGRMFTGDSSGDWLYEALHRFGFATQPTSASRDDGLMLRDCVITAAARCAPPGNKPSPEELDRCRPFLEREVDVLRPRLVMVLGRIAWDAWLRVLVQRGVQLARPRPGFAHGQWIQMEGAPPVLQSYHPSRQNTNTGRLTREMWHAGFARARTWLDADVSRLSVAELSAGRAPRPRPGRANRP